LFGNNKKASYKGTAPTYVGKGMRIEGKICGMRPIWIDGDVQGTIDIASEVIIGEPAIIDATIRASTIKINGHVKGELFASKRIEIMSKGRVKGSVTNLAGCLIIHDGGVVEGVCSIATEEKMKSLLPQEFPKLLTDKTASSVKEIQAPENKVKSSTQPTEKSTENSIN
jgi:cytoskeletal protein CcmA (bactofilin family)